MRKVLLREVLLRYEVQGIMLDAGEVDGRLIKPGVSWRVMGVATMSYGADATGLFADREQAEACKEHVSQRATSYGWTAEFFINEVEVPPPNEEA